MRDSNTDTHRCRHMQIYAFKYICIYSVYIYIHIYICMYVWYMLYRYMYMYLCIQYVYVCIYICISICIYNMCDIYVHKIRIYYMRCLSLI